MFIDVEVCLPTWHLCVMKGGEEMVFTTLMKNKMMFLNMLVGKMLIR